MFVSESPWLFMSSCKNPFNKSDGVQMVPLPTFQDTFTICTAAQRHLRRWHPKAELAWTALGLYWRLRDLKKERTRNYMGWVLKLLCPRELICLALGVLRIWELLTAFQLLKWTLSQLRILWESLQLAQKSPKSFALLEAQLCCPLTTVMPENHCIPCPYYST